MKIVLPFLLTILSLIACNNDNDKTGTNREMVPEPDKQDRLNAEAIEKIRQSGCGFDVPDTSLSGIILRDKDSFEKIIGSNNKNDSGNKYHFYTKLDRETLTLSRYGGDMNSQISIFKVEYSDKADHGYKQLPIDTLFTEKGIRLGLTQDEVIKKLGTCHTTLYNGKNYVELYYLIERPQDSRTGLLKRQNMYMYFASYQFRNNKLETIEFGVRP